jgi:hypothetical protein
MIANLLLFAHFLQTNLKIKHQIIQIPHIALSKYNNPLNLSLSQSCPPPPKPTPTSKLPTPIPPIAKIPNSRPLHKNTYSTKNNARNSINASPSSPIKSRTPSNLITLSKNHSNKSNINSNGSNKYVNATSPQFKMYLFTHAEKKSIRTVKTPT